MKTETIDTIIRHCNGIVAALEKERKDGIVTYKGKALEHCSDQEVLDAFVTAGKDYFQKRGSIQVMQEIRKRELLHAAIAAL